MTWEYRTEDIWISYQGLDGQTLWSRLSRIETVEEVPENAHPREGNEKTILHFASGKEAYSREKHTAIMKRIASAGKPESV